MERYKNMGSKIVQPPRHKDTVVPPYPDTFILPYGGRRSRQMDTKKKNMSCGVRVAGKKRIPGLIRPGNSFKFIVGCHPSCN